MKLNELLELHSAIDLIKEYNNDAINSSRDNWGQVEKGKIDMVNKLSGELSQLASLDAQIINQIKDIILTNKTKKNE